MIHPTPPVVWQQYQKLLFRTFLLFSLVVLIPFDAKYLKQVASIKWSKLTYVDADLLSNYYPWSIDFNGGDNYGTLLTALAVAFIAALIWSAIDRKTQQYNTLYYWLKVIIRYKLAGLMLYFAFIKVFPVQMPFPTVSQLNTIVGDYTPGRLFWIATGASPSYEIFGGVVELLATVLLLWRKTTPLAAFLLAFILVQIVALNICYDTGVQIKSIIILLYALFLLAENIARIWRFFFNQQTEKIISFPSPPLTQKWQRNGRIALKAIFIVFFLGFRGVSVALAYNSGRSFKLPEERGLPQLKGFYYVERFQRNGQELPFNPLDSVRWQNVAFEAWNTLSIKVTRPVKLQVMNSVRKTEIHSNAGRHYFAYKADTLNSILYLHNRADTSKKLSFHFRQIDSLRIQLTGLDEKHDSLNILLTKIPREYPLIEGRHAKEYITY